MDLDDRLTSTSSHGPPGDTETVAGDELSSSTTKDQLGRINFSVSYDFDTQTLTVKIIRAENLAAKDLSGTSDPYVKISLLPDKRHTLTTNVKRKNLNPRWNEIFAFEGQYRSLSLRPFLILSFKIKKLICGCLKCGYKCRTITIAYARHIRRSYCMSRL